MKNLQFILVSFLILVSCSPKMQQKTNEQVETPILKSKSIGYFQASGSNLDWKLEISEERILFQSNDNEIQMPHMEPNQAMDANVKMYRGFVEKGEMTISIYQKKCRALNSQEDFLYEVKISIRSNEDLKEYIGCGNYNMDYRLFDIWVLEELQNKKVTVANFSKEIPLLEINASTKSFSGYGGCNRITGDLFQERELLRFTKIVSTRMACSNVNLEQVFLKDLQSSTSYEIKDNRLYLSNPSGMKLVFLKVD